MEQRKYIAIIAFLRKFMTVFFTLFFNIYILKNNVKKTVINFLKNAIIAIYFLCSIL